MSLSKKIADAIKKMTKVNAMTTQKLINGEKL